MSRTLTEARCARRVAVVVTALTLVAVPVRAEEPPTGAPAATISGGPRETASVAARVAMLRGQEAATRAAARLRVRELYRLVVAGGALPAATRARAVDAGARAIARDVAEARTLAAEARRARMELEGLELAVAAEPPVGARPKLALPVGGAVLARFGAWTDPTTGIVVARPGIRLAARAGDGVRAPGAGTVALVEHEPGGAAVVIDHGAGWTTIVSGLVEVTVAPGASLAAGQPVGTAARVVGFEVWRGRRPVDPLLPQLLTAPALAAPAALP